MPLNPFELAVVLLFHSSAMLRRHWIHWTIFESLSLHLLMNFSLWWYSASDELTSDDVITSGALYLQEHFDFMSSSLQMLLNFLFLFLCSLLFFQNLLMISKFFLSMVMYTWTNISISNWQFFNILLSSKLLRVMLNTFCSNSLPQPYNRINSLVNEIRFIHPLHV